MSRLQLGVEQRLGGEGRQGVVGLMVEREGGRTVRCARKTNVRRVPSSSAHVFDASARQASATINIDHV